MIPSPRPQTVADSPAAKKTSPRTRFCQSWKNLHPLWKSLLAIAALAILAAPFYRVARTANQTRSYGRDLAAAKQALAAGRDVEARDLSLSLLRRDPKNKQALPVFMHAAACTRDALLLPVAGAYLKLDTKDKADRRFAWEVVAKQSPMRLAISTWLMLIRENERADPDFLVPWLQRLVVEDRDQEIETLFATQAGATDPHAERIRLTLLAKGNTEDSYRTLQQRLFERIAALPEDGPILVDVIDEIPQSSLMPNAFARLEKWLKTQGGEPSVENQLRLARCEMAAQPQSADAIITRVAGAHAASAPLPVARLLAVLHRYSQAEELLAPMIAKGDPGVFSTMAGILENQGKLEEWDRLLDVPPAGAFLPGISCDRAFIAAKRGDERAKTKFEQEALVSAERQLHSEDLIHLARHASQRGMDAYATEVWVKAILRGPSSALPLFESITPILQAISSNRQEGQLLDILAVYRTIEPENPYVTSQYFYLSCLIGNEPPAQLLAAISPAREEFPSHALNCFAALANLLEGRNPLAAELTGDIHVDWFSQIPSFRAIRAAALTKTGRKEEADVYMEGFPWKSLLPCEARVFRDLLKPPKESDKAAEALAAEQAEKARIAKSVREAQKADRLEDIRKNLEAKEGVKSEEAKSAERAQRLEKVTLDLQARQAKRAENLEKIRETLMARTMKEAEAAKKALKTEESKDSTGVAEDQGKRGNGDPPDGH